MQGTSAIALLRNFGYSRGRSLLSENWRGVGGSSGRVLALEMRSDPGDCSISFAAPVWRAWFRSANSLPLGSACAGVGDPLQKKYTKWFIESTVPMI